MHQSESLQQKGFTAWSRYLLDASFLMLASAWRIDVNSLCSRDWPMVLKASAHPLAITGLAEVWLIVVSEALQRLL